MNRYSNIVLVGFMGTGKTAVGMALASELNLRFLDMDSVIVQREKKPIPQIFAENGEPYFRALERNLVGELAEQSGLVVATGGGIVLNPGNIADFARTGLVVCLSATPGAILKRVEHDTNRPLLAGGDKMKKITDLLNTRRHLYDAIPCQVDTTNLTVKEITGRISALWRGNTFAGATQFQA
ncbi:MAG: shikimate kinase [Verrucomicrobia bacterium]|nr:shikimate kinase [Verrucomicrobiota bacterium]